jgi:hypothetical protein
VSAGSSSSRRNLNRKISFFEFNLKALSESVTQREREFEKPARNFPIPILRKRATQEEKSIGFAR